MLTKLFTATSWTSLALSSRRRIIDSTTLVSLAGSMVKASLRSSSVKSVTDVIRKSYKKETEVRGSFSITLEDVSEESEEKKKKR